MHANFTHYYMHLVAWLKDLAEINNVESVQVCRGCHILMIDIKFFVARLYMLRYLVAYHVN